MFHNKRKQVHILTCSPNYHQVYDQSIQHQAHNSHQVHRQLWLISTLCNALRHDTYMHVVPNHLWGRHPWCQLNIINNPNNWIQRILQQHVMMHEWLNNNAHVHTTSTIEINIFHDMHTPTIQHHCMYKNSPTIYMHINIYNHQQLHHNNSTTS